MEMTGRFRSGGARNGKQKPRMSDGLLTRLLAESGPWVLLVF